MAGLDKSAPLVWVKKEDLRDESPASYDFQEVAATTVKIKQEEDAEEPALAAVGTVDAPPVDEDSLVLLNPDQASQRPFPPNCPVLCVTPTSIVLGTVETVFIDISSETRQFVYRILDMDSTSFIATEEQLQWGASCPVWASFSTMPVHQEACQPCVVDAIYQKNRQSEPLYTLKANDGSLHHGIPKCCIRYRIQEKPTISATSIQQDDSFTPDSSTLTRANAQPTGGATTMQQYDDGTAGYMPVSDKESRHSPTDSVSELTVAATLTDLAPSEKTLPIKRPHSVEEARDSKKQMLGLGDRFQPARHVVVSRSAYENSGAQVGPSEAITGSYQSLSTGGSQNRAEQHQTTHDIVPKNRENKDQNMITENFYVPLMKIFSLDDLKAFNHCHSQTIMGKTKCSLQLRSASSNDCVRFEMTGTQRDIGTASNRLEQLLVRATEPDNWPRLLYFLALWNGHRRKQGKIVHQVCVSNTSRKKWMYCKELPQDIRRYLPLVIGSGGKRTKRMERMTQCSIRLHVRDQVPHYIIYGDSVDCVVECIDLLECSMASAKKSHEAGYK